MYVMFTNLIMLFLLKKPLDPDYTLVFCISTTMSETPRSGIAPSSIEEKKSVMVYICGECHQVNLLLSA